MARRPTPAEPARTHFRATLVGEDASDTVNRAMEMARDLCGDDRAGRRLEYICADWLSFVEGMETEQPGILITPTDPPGWSYTVNAPGIWYYESSDRAGILLDPEHNAQMPPEWRREDLWYEENLRQVQVSDNFRVIAVFPDAFGPMQIESAESQLRDDPVFRRLRAPRRTGRRNLEL